MSDDTRAYFVAMIEFDWAMGEKRFSQALVALKTGLRESERALTSMQKEGDSIPPAIPFIGTKAGALVALTNDEEAFDLMDTLATYLGGKNPAQIRRYRDDAIAIEQVRSKLQNVPEISADALKRELAPEVHGRLLRLLAWMEKNSELSVEKQGKTILVRSGPAPRQGNIVAPTFRGGEPIATPLARPLPYLDRDRSRPNTGGESLIVELPNRGTPIPVADRLPGVMRTYPLRDGFWLIGHARTLPNGAGETKVVVKSKRGDTLTSFVLGRRVVRAFSSFQREHIIVLDSTLTISVFDLMGNYVNEFGLAKNPEIRSVIGTIDDATKPTALLRAVDVSPVSGDIAFSVIDYVWRFTAAGKPVSAFHLPVGDRRGANNALSHQTGSELSIPEKVQIFSGRDWIYLVRFSDRNDSLLVSTYSGNLIRISSCGEFESHWDVFGPATDILERLDDLVISTFRGTSFVDVNGVVGHHARTDGTFYSDTQLVNRASLFNPVSQSGVEYLASADLRGVYPVDGNLRVEMKTTYSDVEFP
jgi:hypothetical protein